MIFISMNLKKIIKEELYGLEWIKNIKPTLNDAFEQGTLKKGDVLTLSGELADCDAKTKIEVNDFKIKITKLRKKINNSHFIPLQKKYWEHLEYDGKGDTRFYTSDGKMKIEDHHNELMESNDLQWIKDIKPIPELKVGTCFIDVMDSTQTEWIIIDFKMTLGGTPIVVVKNKKNNTDIRHIHKGYFEEDLLSHRYKPCSNKLMESNELDWIKDIEPRLPLKIGTCLTFKQYEEEEDWVEDEYGNMVDHGKMDWYIIGEFIDEYNDKKPTFKMVATDRMGEGRELWMEVEKVKELYDRGVYQPCKKQTYLKRIMESNDFR